MDKTTRKCVTDSLMMYLPLLIFEVVFITFIADNDRQILEGFMGFYFLLTAFMNTIDNKIVMCELKEIKDEVSLVHKVNNANIINTSEKIDKIESKISNK